MTTGQTDIIFPIDNEIVGTKGELFTTSGLDGVVESITGPIDDRGFWIVGFVWLLVVIWTLKDSIYRSSSLLFQVFSVIIVAVGTPLVGLPLYLAIRPLGYKHERAYWKMIMQGYTISDRVQTHSSQYDESGESIMSQDDISYTSPTTKRTIKTPSKGASKTRKSTPKTPRKRVITLEE